MNISSEAVMDILSGVKHPETGADIVSMGMVHGLEVDQHKVSFTLKLTKNNDPFASSIKKAATKTIKERFGEEVEVEIMVVANVEPRVSPLKQKASISKVKNIVAIASGKGGVGKSTIAANLAVAVAKTGAKVGLIDADIYGPSMPKMFNLEHTQPEIVKEDGLELIVPVENYGVKLLSIGFFVDPNSALVWRGPMATSALKQLIHQGAWGELDYLFIDMPPGTSDIHLTLVQEVPVTGAIIVSTPQDVALADAVKGISMFTSQSINVPVLGLVENMAWFTPEELPDNKYYIFGKEGCKKLADRMKLPLLGQIPIVQSIREGGDYGEPVAIHSSIVGKAFDELAKNVIERVEWRNRELPPTKIVNVQHK
ncbi:Mrp/NBP35 family ATP-binding protein [Tenuifilum thalassicum]|uniref:Iron-sulfur cluster carrier protein n=1 Tax=Tenuifilum thalassicum TaxID=2590900 RepID=A0A7D3XJH9_9BACT|nr:Mrp/NBP35 family ATP-binding protein [Tenuifilum thalassicum]QKG78910.1 Mrp/NBP35 family ATP-binding protein [Tenuifilum thalassicum]